MAERIDARTDILRFIFLKTRERMVSESEALQNNLTETFFEWMRDKIDSRELIVFAVLGEVRTGKSTVVIKIVWEINKYIQHIGLNSDPLKNMTKYIFSDQTEFLRFINGNERNAGLVIDEFNDMARTGLNATTEEALLDYYSNIFAGQYLHRGAASPDVVTDKNTTVILEVYGKDEANRTIRCKLKYRDVISKQQMTIGFVDIFVGDLIKGWIDSGVRDIIEKHGVRNLEDQKKVDKLRETDFYVRYQIKKYRRMDLLKKHGVRDIRDLEYSVIVLQVLEELEDYAKISRIDKELIDTVTDEVCKTNKRIYSILTVNEISQRSKAILNLYHKINDMQKKKNKCKDPNELLVFSKTIEQTIQLLEKRVSEQKKYAALYRDYMKIE